MSNVPYTVTDTAITAVVNGTTYTVKKGDPAYAQAHEAVMRKDWEALVRYASKALAIEQWIRGRFTVDTVTCTIYFDKEKLPQGINSRIVEMARMGKDPSLWLRFWQKLQDNPSWRSVQALFTFMSNENLPLAEDGDLLAYKSVRRTYLDRYSNSWDNSPGTINQIPRNKVSDDYSRACHLGFHLGTLGYAQRFGSSGRIVICKVNPRDVVCVPTDASQGKIRCCRYQVVGNYGDDLDSAYFDEDPLPPLQQSEIIELLEEPIEPVAYEDEEEEEPIEPVAYEDEEEEEEETPVNAKLDSERKALKKVYSDAPADRRAVLMSQRMDVLRGHAVRLGIKGAGHIRGGKASLVDNYILPKEKELGYVAGSQMPKIRPDDPAEKAARIKAGTPAPVVRPADPSNPYQVLDTYGKAELEQQTLLTLRKYARHHLKIVGAGHIRGGKRALIARILEVRSY